MARQTLLLTGGSGMVGRNILEHPAAGDWTILAPASRELDLMDAGAVTDYVATVRRRMIWNSLADFGAEGAGSSGSGYAA